MPASVNVVPPSPVLAPHCSPATTHPGTPGGWGAVHRPSVLPWALVQMPLQHCASLAQTSVFCVQNDPVLEHRPPLQNFEQHSKFCVQELPDVRHVLRGVHLPPPQVPPQH